MYTNYASNLVAGIKIADISESTISSLNDSPDAVGTASYLLSLGVEYTFAESRNQIFFIGDSVGDVVRFDSSSQVGVRHEFMDKSILQKGVATIRIKPIKSEGYKEMLFELNPLFLLPLTTIVATPFTVLLFIYPHSN